MAENEKESGQCEYACLSNGVVCSKAPCNLIIGRFGIHERIIDFLVSSTLYDEAYYYIQDLLSSEILKINCDIEVMESLRKNQKDIPLSDYPPGCRVFKISNLLKENRREIHRYNDMKKLEDKENVIGLVATEIFKTNTRLFVERISSILDILKHLIVDERYKVSRRGEEHEKLLDYYYEAQRARSSGLSVETGIGTTLEAGFEKAGRLSNPELYKAKDEMNKTKQAAKVNEEKIKQAERKVEINKLLILLKQFIKEGKDTTEIENRINGLGG